MTYKQKNSFTISVSQTFVRNYYNVDRTFFPADDNERTFTRSLLHLKQFLKRGLIHSYPGRLTADTGIECRIAYLGTYSGYELTTYFGHRQNYTVMIVPTRNKKVYGADFTKVIDFYKTYLNMPEDPENRGYGRYRSSQVNQWWRDVPS